MKNKQKNEYIKELPDMFSVNDFIMFTGMQYNSAKVYLHRWAKSKSIFAMGGKTGLYFKTIQAKEDLYEEALLKVYPGAVLIGVNVLYNEGLTPQIPRIWNIAIPETKSFPKIENVNVYLRGKKWYRLFKDKKCRVLEKEGVPSMSPEFALADILKYNLAPKIDPDDIYIEDMNMELFLELCNKLKVPNEVVAHYYQQGPAFS